MTLSSLPPNRILPSAAFEAGFDGSRTARVRVGHLTAGQIEELVNCSPDAMLCLDREYNIVFANEPALHLTGTPHLVGGNIWTLFPGNLKDPFSTSYRSTMELRVETRFEAYYPEPLNMWFSVVARPLAMGMAIFFREINERKRVEALQEAQQELLAAVQQGALVATWTLDTQTGRMEFGPGSYPVFGRGMETLSTLPKLLEAVSPADRGRVLAATREAVRVRRMFTVDFEVTEAGSGVWVEVRGQVLGGADEAIRVGGIAMDISVRKRGERALLAQQLETERQRAELETIYQTAAIGLASISAGDLRYLRLNERQAELIGLPIEEITGRTLMEIAPEVVGLEEVFRGVEAGVPVRDMMLEGELPARPGEQRVWSVSYTPVRGEDGTVVSITAASFEITQRKRAEAALLHSEKLAAVGRLASSISHEINNPLEAVTNLLYIVATDEGLPEELRGYLQTAQDELSRVSQIAMQTLRFHRQATKPTRVAAGTLIGAVLDLYQGRLFNSGIKIDARYATGEEILCFENDVRQVLNNLIANAIDAMEGGGRIVVRAHGTHDAAGRRVARITIADTGHGMSAATMTRVFDAFFTTKDLNGTGLGLWISSEIVSRHHGRLKVRSSKNPRHRGTVFTLVLPFDEIPEEAKNPSAYAPIGGG